MFYKVHIEYREVNMNSALSTCPVCGEPLTIVRLHCNNCDTTIEGRFTMGGLGNLTPDQIQFVEMFIRSEGKITRMQKLLNISYPTVRSRLEEIIRAMGYEVGQEDEDDDTAAREELRRQVLDDLSAGRITSQDAIRLLQA